MRRAPLTVCLLTVTVAALLQGCFVGRSLYLAEETPTSDELRASSSLDDSDGGSSGGDAATNVSRSDGAPDSMPVSPPPPAGGGTETCTAIAAECTKGGGMEYCITLSAAGTCSKLAYKHNGQSFACPTGCGGNDCLPAYYGAYTACQDAVGACTQLASCCQAALPANQASCLDTHKTYVKEVYGDVACKAVLASYRSSKICP